MNVFEPDVREMGKIDGTDYKNAARPPIGHQVVSSVGLWYEFDGEKYVPVDTP